MKKKILLISICVFLSGCSVNKNNKESNENITKKIYLEYLNTNWDNAFGDEQYGIDEFALLDANNDGILDLIIKNNEVNIISIISTSNNEEPVTVKGYILASNTDIDYKYHERILEMESNIDNIVVNEKNLKEYECYPLYDNSDLYLINNEFLSIPLVYQENIWGYEYYTFTFSNCKPEPNKQGFKINKNLKKWIDEDFSSQNLKDKGFITYDFIFDMNGNWNGSLYATENSFLENINLYNEFGGPNYSINQNYYSDMYYNYFTQTMGENIKSIEKIEFVPCTLDNRIKYLSN